MNKLSNTIKEMALAANACGKVMDSWTDEMTDDSMVRLFVEQSNFCLSEGVPSIDFIRTHFSKELLHAHAIYIDESVEGMEVEGKAIFLGNCTGDVLVLPWKVADIQVAGDSRISVLCGLRTIVHVGIFDKCNIKVDSSAPYSVAYVHKYADDIDISAVGDVREKRVHLSNTHD